MEDMAVSLALADTSEGKLDLLEGNGPLDLRDYCRLLERAGELHRVKAEVDLDQEMSALVYVAHRRVGAPALLFERVKGYSTPVLWNMLGSSTRRYAIAMGIRQDADLKTLIQAVRLRLKRPIPPKTVAETEAPVFENSLPGDEVDVLKFPAPRHWPLDGGRQRLRLKPPLILAVKRQGVRRAGSLAASARRMAKWSWCFGDGRRS